jgi:hypothetical protein
VLRVKSLSDHQDQYGFEFKLYEIYKTDSDHCMPVVLSSTRNVKEPKIR